MPCSSRGRRSSTRWRRWPAGPTWCRPSPGWSTPSTSPAGRPSTRWPTSPRSGWRCAGRWPPAARCGSATCPPPTPSPSTTPTAARSARTRSPRWPPPPATTTPSGGGRTSSSTATTAPRSSPSSPRRWPPFATTSRPGATTRAGAAGGARPTSTRGLHQPPPTHTTSSGKRPCARRSGPRWPAAQPGSPSSAAPGMRRPLSRKGSRPPRPTPPASRGCPNSRWPPPGCRGRRRCSPAAPATAPASTPPAGTATSPPLPTPPLPGSWSRRPGSYATGATT